MGQVDPRIRWDDGGLTTFDSSRIENVPEEGFIIYR
jgi:hypothetical protein